MPLKSAILFNGAASLIAQEVGMLDLLLGNITDVPGVGLNIPQDVKFIGGLSSGSLMTFFVNAAFSENPALTWDSFKNDILFPLKTEDVYNGTHGLFQPYNTEPLNSLLTRICNQVNYHTLTDLPFDSAILTVAKVNYRTCWLNNIPQVINKLPQGYFHVYESIRQHELDLELVSSLMCSTAIPILFPQQELYYQDGDGKQSITKYSGLDAHFCDGGTIGIFRRFEEFFEIYGEKFDKIYFISPNFPSIEEEAFKLIDAVAPKLAAAKLDSHHIIDHHTNECIQELKEYNSDCRLANYIYYCQPEVSGYNPLNFSEETEQYNDTISWGRCNPDKIAIDINSIC
ncbi:MAG: hypothetical protein F6K41_36615 [Symploca sp. SIO3E6]|nr:hypothetical protein [Caldora sp. SIO3E6]